MIDLCLWKVQDDETHIIRKKVSLLFFLVLSLLLPSVSNKCGHCVAMTFGLGSSRGGWWFWSVCLGESSIVEYKKIHVIRTRGRTHDVVLSSIRVRPSDFSAVATD